MTDRPETVETRRKRLHFRSRHRGTKEMDILLGDFADEKLATFSDSELDQLEALLDESDDDLYAWVMGRKAIPGGLSTSVLRAFRDSVQRRGGDTSP